MKESRLGRYVAQLPYAIGHQLGEQHVVVDAHDSDMRPLVHLTIDWNDGPGDDHATAHHNTEYLAMALRKHHVKGLVVTAYGPHGPARAHATAEALEKAFDVRPLQIHVHDGHARVRNHTTGHWGPATPVTGFVARAALDGQPPPASSRTELLESVTPLPTPLFGHLDATTARKLRGSSPLLQVDVAQRALDNLATSRVDDLGQMTLLSHLITTETLARDTVLVHAINDHDELMNARTSALVRTFRAAPPDQRPRLATVAAAATFLAAWHTPIVHGLLKHADKDAELTSLVHQAVRFGVDPRPMRPALTQATERLLAEAETNWSTSHPTTGRSSGRTSTPLRPQSHAPGHHTDPAPIEPGADSRDL